MGEIIRIAVTMPKRVLTMELDAVQARDLIIALTDDGNRVLPSPGKSQIIALTAIRDGKST